MVLRLTNEQGKLWTGTEGGLASLDNENWAVQLRATNQPGLELFYYPDQIR